MPTFRCTAECTHCGTLSSPREKTWLSKGHIFSAIDQAIDNGYKLVVFTGGEPTLAGETLLSGIERAAFQGLPVRIVTNGWWASSDEKAKRRVAEFVRAGLTELNTSTGDQHTRFVPLGNMIRAARVSVEAGLRVAIMVEVVKQRTVTKETVESHPEYERICRDFPDAQPEIIESPWMPLSPAANNEYPEGLAANKTNLISRTGCDSVLSTTTVHADGTMASCCGLGMRLIPELHQGNIEDTTLADADRAAENDFLKRWIRLEGPERIVAWAATHNPDIEWENMYAHRCQACIRLYKDPKIRQVIKEHHQEKMADVLFGEWLLFRYNPEGDGLSQEPHATSAGNEPV